MQDYEIFNNDYENMTTEQVNQEIGRLNAEQLADPGHPFLDNLHPQHKAFVEHSRRLSEKQAEAENEAQEQAEAKKVEDFYAGITAKQDELIEQAETEMDKLVELGFDRAKIPKDIQPYQITSLRIQRLDAEGKSNEAAVLLEQVMRDVGYPPNLRDLAGQFMRSKDLDAGFRDELLCRALRMICQQKKTKDEMTKPPPVSEQE